MTDIATLATKLRVDELQAKSILFWVVDFLIERELSEDVLDCGRWHNHPHNGTDNMIESHKAMLWASFEELDGQKVDKPGPFVMFNPNTMQIELEYR